VADAYCKAALLLHLHGIIMVYQELGIMSGFYEIILAICASHES
jgi:hypothetical protein